MESYSLNDLLVGEEVLIIVKENSDEFFAAGNVLIKSPTAKNSYAVYTAAVNTNGDFCVFADGSGVPNTKIRRQIINKDKPLGVYSTNQELCYLLKVE